MAKKYSADLHFQKLSELDKHEEERDKIFASIMGESTTSTTQKLVPTVENNISGLQPGPQSTLFDQPSQDDQFVLHPDPENHLISLTGVDALIATLPTADEITLDLEPVTPLVPASAVITVNSKTNPLELNHSTSFPLFNLTKSTLLSFDHDNYLFQPGVSSSLDDNNIPPPPGKKWNEMYSQPRDPVISMELQSNPKLVQKHTTPQSPQHTSLTSFFGDLFAPESTEAFATVNRANKSKQFQKVLKIEPNCFLAQTQILNVAAPRLAGVPPSVHVRLSRQRQLDRINRHEDGTDGFNTAGCSGIKYSALDQRMVTIRNDDIIGLLMVLFSHQDDWKLNQITKERAYQLWVELLLSARDIISAGNATAHYDPQHFEDAKDAFLEDLLAFKLSPHLHHYPPQHSLASPAAVAEARSVKPTKGSKFHLALTKQQILEDYEPNDYIDCDSFMFFLHDFPLNDVDFASTLQKWVTDHDQKTPQAPQE